MAFYSEDSCGQLVVLVGIFLLLIPRSVVVLGVLFCLFGAGGSRGFREHVMDVITGRATPSQELRYGRG